MQRQLLPDTSVGRLFWTIAIQVPLVNSPQKWTDIKDQIMTVVSFFLSPSLGSFVNRKLEVFDGDFKTMSMSLMDPTLIFILRYKVTCSRTPTHTLFIHSSTLNFKIFVLFWKSLKLKTLTNLMSSVLKKHKYSHTIYTDKQFRFISIHSVM